MRARGDPRVDVEDTLFRRRPRPLVLPLLPQDPREVRLNADQLLLEIVHGILALRTVSLGEAYQTEQTNTYSTQLVALRHHFLLVNRF